MPMANVITANELKQLSENALYSEKITAWVILLIEIPLRIL